MLPNLYHHVHKFDNALIDLINKQSNKEIHYQNVNLVSNGNFKLRKNFNLRENVQDIFREKKISKNFFLYYWLNNCVKKDLIDY